MGSRGPAIARQGAGPRTHCVSETAMAYGWSVGD